MEFISKLIEIDENLPPFTIIDKQKLPLEGCARLKKMLFKATYSLVGLVVGLSPLIIDLIIKSTNDSDQSSGCDISELEDLLRACNITGW